MISCGQYMSYLSQIDVICTGVGADGFNHYPLLIFVWDKFLKIEQKYSQIRKKLHKNLFWYGRILPHYHDIPALRKKKI